MKIRARLSRWVDAIRGDDARRARTPTVLQMEAAECGAAALAIVLGYHGRNVPLEVLRLECGVSRDGSKASNVLKAARKYGLDARGFKKEPKDLRQMALPAIVFWNFNHFLVLEGFGRDKVYLNDPASGPRVVSESEFDQSFTGVVLALQPGPEFRKGGERRSLIAALSRRLQGSRPGLVFAILAGLALVGPGLVIPAFARIFVDQVLIAGLDDWIRPLLIGMTLTALLRAGLSWLQQHYLLRLETKLALETSSRFVWHVLRLPAEFFSQRYAGDIATRVGLNDGVAQLLSGRLASTALSIVMVVFYLIVMLLYDVPLTLVGVAVALANVLALRFVSRARVDQNQKLVQEQAKLVSVSMQGVQVIETLKASGAEGDFFAKWSGYQAKVVNAQQQLEVSTRMLSEVPPLLQALLTVTILCLGGLRVMEGHLSMGMLVAFQTLMASFIGPVNELVNLGATLQEVEADMNRLDDVLSYQVEPGPDPHVEAGEPARRLRGLLELRGISFGYSRLDPPLIRDFSLVLRPGARVALVGASGSGKSTVSRLVAGLYEPWEGEILFDGKPRREHSRATLSGSLAMVDQDIFLIEGTIRENLTLWDPTVRESSLVAAAKDASIHAEIAARPGGYESRVLEGGRNFSGGQRQRLEIARALVTDPVFLVLDEATSALDPRTEELVDESLRRRRCTCLIVAHRLSAIRDCDEIVVLERGRIVERGTHEELVVAGGTYRRLIESS